LGFAEHFWDDRVEGAFPFYVPQTFAKVSQTREEIKQIQDPGMRYQQDEEDFDSLDDDEEMDDYEGLVDIDDEDDELEDIMERNATITDHENGKEVWKSVNFMTPADDLEFEFIELEDENE